MTRPLLSKTSAQLQEAVNRNRDNRFELELILAELRHRKTALARTIERTARLHLERISRESVTDAGASMAKVLFTGKYDAVHRKALAVGSPVIVGWQYKDLVFLSGSPAKGRISSVYAAIQRLAAGAGNAGLTGADLATRLRVDQTGNPRSEYCQGLPPVGWAEGWIDTAVQKGLIVEKPAVATSIIASKPKANPTGQKPSLSLEEINEQMAANWHDPARLKQLNLPLDQHPDDARYLRERLAQRVTELERQTPIAPVQKDAAVTSKASKIASSEKTIHKERVESEMPVPGLPSDVRAHTEQAIAQLRTKLIDLSRRSPLISFKHGGRAATLVRIVDERPDLVFEIINKNGAGFEPLPGQDTTPKDETTDSFRLAYENALLTDQEFLAATERLGDDERDAEQWQKAERALRARVRSSLALPPLEYGKGLDISALAVAHGFDPSFDLKDSDDPDVASHHQDDKLRVLLIEKDLEKRLKSIWDRYRSHERETGLHTLFLVYGFVQWYDEQTGDTPHHAPALLQAVTLERRVSRGRYEYLVRPHDDGLQINVALAEKMRQHMGLAMPELREDETPESYFIRLEQILAKGNRVKLRRFLTLSVLPFPQMILWKDLDSTHWFGGFAKHRLIPALVGAAPINGDASPREPYDIDDPVWAARAPVLIRPADASQHSALIETAEGHDLAVEGPPGTGKSETITNMIATALDQGKKVLFVAEKQAALRVVADRLRASGFGPLLLELHGETARRDDVYKSIKDRLEARVTADPVALERARAELVARRDRIRNYLALIRTPLGSLKITAYAVTWREISLRHKLSDQVVEQNLSLFPIANPKEITQAQLNDMRSNLTIFAQAVKELKGNGERSRTYWICARRLPVFGHASQLAWAQKAAEAASEVATAGDTLLSNTGLSIADPTGDLEPVISQLNRLPKLSVEDNEVVRAAIINPDAARTLLRQQTRWRQLVGKLQLDINQPETVSAETIERLAHALAAFAEIPANPAENEARLGDYTRARDMLEQGSAARAQIVRTVDRRAKRTPLAG